MKILDRAIKRTRSVSIRFFVRLENHLGLCLVLFGLTLLAFGTVNFVEAQTGGDIFKEAAINIACNVMPGKFGAMLTAFTGIFALVAAATGSYRGAWALLFVSVGAYIFKELVSILFGGTINNCG